MATHCMCYELNKLQFILLFCLFNFSTEKYFKRRGMLSKREFSMKCHSHRTGKSEKGIINRFQKGYSLNEVRSIALSPSLPMCLRVFVCDAYGLADRHAKHDLCVLCTFHNT